MKAVVYSRYGGPEVLRVAEIDQPTPMANEVLIRVHAAAVTTVDAIFRKGSPIVARFATGLLKPRKSVLGTELSGVVEAVGAAVTRYSPGDAVYASTGDSLGAHAEYLCLRETSALALKPGSLTHVEAAALCEGSLTALPFLRDKARIQPGQRILIIGASGSVGSAAVQLARYMGAEVTGVCGPSNLEWVRDLGAVAVIDYTKDDFTHHFDEYDVIFDAVGKRSFWQCKRSLRPNGIYMTTTLGPQIVGDMMWTSVAGGKKAIIALTGLRAPNDRADDLNAIRELVDAGVLKPVIDRVYALEEIAEAHRHVDSGHKKGNVVLDLGV